MTMSDKPKGEPRGTPRTSTKRKASRLSEVSILGNSSNVKDGSPSQSKKRKLDALNTDVDEETENVYEDEDEAAAANAALAGINSKPNGIRKKPKSGEPAEEKRLKQFRKHAPKTYLERLDRVRTQRMFLIDRKKRMSSDGKHEEETFDIAGSTGNVYQVTISKLPRCSCPDALNGNQCKHIVYIMVNVLKAPEHLAYQVAFLTTELTTIFAFAPITPQSSNETVPSESSPGNRKPTEGDCPVCVMEFQPESEEIVWCRAACGNNIHRQCFEQWAASKPGQAKCVYCRTPWKGDEESVKRISKMGKRNEEGYINVAGELGLSGERDMSSYHQLWVSRQRYGSHW